MLRRLTVTAVAICAFSSGALAQIPAPSPREPEVTANGRGETRLAPDYAYVTIGVTNQASNAVEAASENAKRTESILGALRSFGLDDRQLLTSRYNLTQNYEYPKNAPPKPSGFVARSSIRAEVHRLPDLGKILDASIANGATEVAGVQFLATNTDDARRSAMTQAVKQARSDADAMARAAGGTLGRLIALNSGIMQPVYNTRENAQLLAGITTVGMAGGMAAGPPPTSIVPGEIIVSAQVFSRWEFVPGPSR
jgi:uncharacterized protein YggE